MIEDVFHGGGCALNTMDDDLLPFQQTQKLVERRATFGGVKLKDGPFPGNILFQVIQLLWQER